VPAVTMEREFARRYTRLMKMKMNNPKERNRDATARRNRCGGAVAAAMSLRYFFFSILVMVSPDWVKVTRSPACSASSDTPCTL
jgi:hypothetical protein